MPSIDISNLQAWYGESHVLHDVSFQVAVGEVVTLLGRNGAGKTTTLRAIMGILKKRQGSVKIDGRETVSLPSRAIARSGVGYVPEERGIFASLTVTENLMLPPMLGESGFTVAEVLEMFPNLHGRRSSSGRTLSGGEQQMLAIARVLRAGAPLLLLDEPTEGLAPVIVQQIGRAIALMRQRGLTIVLVEQNLHFVTSIADRHVVIEEGRTVDVIARADMASSAEKLKKYLGV